MQNMSEPKSEIQNYVNEFKLDFLCGMLYTKDGWSNVKLHQITEFFEVGVLSEMLGISDEERKEMQSVALIHDWDKRLEKEPSLVTPELKNEIDKYYKEINPNPSLMLATGPEFVVKFVSNPEKVSFLEMIQFYVDDITKGGDIVRLSERLNDVESRKTELNNDPKLIQELKGKKFWNAERDVANEVEKIIFEKLKEKGVDIEVPEEIPDLVVKKIKAIKHD